MQNLSSLRGFVKMSASYFSVHTNSSNTSPELTWSLMKWCLISMCLLLECCTGFFDRLIALVLSQNMGVLVSSMPKSLSCCLIHKIWAQQLPAIIYSASAVDNTTEFYFLLNHEIKLTPRNWQVPEVLFLSNLHPAKSVSE